MPIGLQHKIYHRTMQSPVRQQNPYNTSQNFPRIALVWLILFNYVTSVGANNNFISENLYMTWTIMQILTF